MTKADTIIPITLPTPFDVGPVNCFLLKGEAVTLIDSGPKTHEARELLLASLNEHGLKFEDLDQYICTHYHPDHAGLSKEIQEAGVQTIMLKEAVPYVSGNSEFLKWTESFYTKLYSHFGVPDSFGRLELVKLKKLRSYMSTFTPDLTALPGEAVPGHSGFIFLKTPGHAPDHLALYHEEQGIFIGGDVLLPHISSNALLEPPALYETKRPKTLLQYRETLKNLLTLNLRTVYPGHGEPFSNASELIQKRLHDQEERAKTIENLLGQDSLTVFDLCVRLFPKLFERQLGLVVSEVAGHLDLLLDENRIMKDENQGLFYFSQTGAIR
ncbi:MBL fold metallo-hydrolase [Fictibacillus barbaricus]|uniref:Glyoxylase-like metal-dependent hydrolase (Beta-lactamase superfamily II) n=1 Tax=Fictibacillus barbaricus TaxID=182136 RepID=A0ABU1TZK9_9BACL|nr:MBL fold metallo-hydrolase [Fictibacillus barbaricus]MDR7072642.1 glyoxylase-like metal-dependent hydrolase (beta-lactamase superfamily II) [Fictibacillus barbaricus]